MSCESHNQIKERKSKPAHRPTLAILSCGFPYRDRELDVAQHCSKFTQPLLLRDAVNSGRNARRKGLRP